MNSIAPARIFDITDPSWKQIGTAFHLLDGEHCWHMRHEPTGYRYETLARGESGFESRWDSTEYIDRYVYRDTRFIDACCRPGCKREEIR